MQLPNATHLSDWGHATITCNAGGCDMGFSGLKQAVMRPHIVFQPLGNYSLIGDPRWIAFQKAVDR